MSERLMNTISNRWGVTLSSGDGPYLITSRGRRILDLFADSGTASLGYATEFHQAVLRTMSRQHIPFHSPSLFGHTVRDEAATKLCDNALMDKVFFCNSGTESVEAAIKIARKAKHVQGRDSGPIYTYRGGFHGRTYGALSATDGPAYYTDGFGPMLPGFNTFKELDDIWWAMVPDAILLCPVFGDKDIKVYPDGWLQELRDKCDEHGTLLIFDEVQTGNGRCGSMTYAKRIGVQPDVMCMAKGVAMGAPVGATLARGSAADVLQPGTHFSTFGGNPLGCASVIAMQSWLKENVGTVDQKGAYLRESLKSKPWASNVRGVGLFQAFDVDVPRLRLADEMIKRDVLIGAFRDGPGAVKLTPPLTITYGDMDRAIETLEEAISDCHS